jgi:hypothetical protein
MKAGEEVICKPTPDPPPNGRRSGAAGVMRSCCSAQPAYARCARHTSRKAAERRQSTRHPLSFPLRSFSIFSGCLPASFLRRQRPLRFSERSVHRRQRPYQASSPAAQGTSLSPTYHHNTRTSSDTDQTSEGDICDGAVMTREGLPWYRKRPPCAWGQGR